jgi:hypothetical protein
MFNSLFNRNKIKVNLIEAVSNEQIGQVKLNADQLPASFKIATTFSYEGEDWQIEKAEPETVEEFSKTKELSLWLKKILKYDPRNIRYSIPTINNELPLFSSTSLYSDFTHTIHEDDWRQFEFLPTTLLTVVQEEMTVVENILFPEDDPDFDSTNGFTKIHVRTKINSQQLSISLEDLLTHVVVQQKGKLKIDKHAEFVLNGFAFKTEHHLYYGTIENGVIKELCLDFFDSMDEEISNILSNYNLLLVSWCRGEINSG